MKIKEYIKIQAEKCQNEVMKEIFIDLVDMFYPKPKQSTNTNLVPWEPVSKASNDNFYKRKVRIQKMPNGKASIGLIDSDEMGVKLPKKEHLDFALVDENKTTYYYGLEHIFFKKDKSRILFMIDKNNYNEHRTNVELIRDYVLINNEIVRID